MVYVPCRNCTKRNITCHCNCEKYEQFKIDLKNEKEVLNKDRIVRSTNIEIFSNYRRRSKRV